MRRYGREPTVSYYTQAFPRFAGWSSDHNETSKNNIPTNTKFARPDEVQHSDAEISMYMLSERLFRMFWVVAC